MSAAVANLKRQWIPIVGGSCDVRMGPRALDQASVLFKAAVGTPCRSIVVLRDNEDENIVELLRRQLVDAGFQVFWHRLGEGNVCSMEEAVRLAASCGECGITADDLCCAFGDAEVQSLASFVCGSWCDATTLVGIPTDQIAFLEGALVPRALDVGGKSEMMSARACVRHVLLDYDIVLDDLSSESSRYARALMVSAAMGGSEKLFSELWDRAPAIALGDESATQTQLLAAAKSRGQALSSTAVAVRQSVKYGRAFAHALQRLIDEPLERGALVGEGMRFCSRLAVGLQKLSVDDMLAQDELLDTLDVGSITCDVEPDALVVAMKDELFMRSNRSMMLVPLSIGRVRLSAIPDDMLLEHTTAWCDAHATNR